MNINLSLGAIQDILNATCDVRDFIHDDGAGNDAISTMAYIPKFKSSGWPQSALNGLELGGVWMDAFKCCQPDASSTSVGSTPTDTPGAIAACSRAGVIPWHTISWINARTACANRVIDGRACHLVTPYDRMSLFSWIMHTGNWGNVRGNNNNGKDTRDSDSWENYGIIDPDLASGKYRTLNGSGPASWWSGGIIGAGVCDLVGNIYEWEDMRLESGIYQPKAYLNGAVTAADTEIAYDDNAGGDAANICHLTPGVYTITDAVNGDEDVTVERVIVTGQYTGILCLSAGTSSDHGDDCVIQLKTAIDLCQDDAGTWKAIGALLEDAASKYMALPDYSDTSTHAATYLDSWYAYDNGDSRVARRSGNWGNTEGARAGLRVGTGKTPTGADSIIGFRAALHMGDR